MRISSSPNLSYLFLVLSFCKAKSFRLGENPARRLALVSTVGRTVIDYADPLIKSNGTIIATNEIGESVNDFSVGVTLLDFGCENEIEKTGFEIELSNVTEYVRGGQYQWKIQVIPERLGDSPFELTQYSAGSDDQNAAGVIQFCTRVSTWFFNVQVGFREHNVRIPFTINDYVFSVGNFYLDQDNPKEFAWLNACQCEAFNCLEQQTPLQEDDRFEICLIPKSVVGDPRITNFNVLIVDPNDGTSEYEPIAYGTDSWIPHPEAVVQKDPNSATIMINTLLRSGTMSEFNSTVRVSGGAMIEVVEGAFSFHVFELMLDVKEKEMKGIAGIGLFRRFMTPLADVIFKWRECFFSGLPTIVFVFSDELFFVIDP